MQKGGEGRERGRKGKTVGEGEVRIFVGFISSPSP